MCSHLVDISSAGTSFAWEKHLALRNTPYSTVRHSRVFRGSDTIERRGDDLRSDRRLDEGDGYSERSISSSLSLKGTPTKLSEKLFPADAEIWPTPKGILNCEKN